MPLVEAAANVRYYSENLDPYNTSWDMGKNIYFAQTFPLTAGSRLFRTCFQVCCHTPFDPWQYSIRATDGAGKPLTVDLTMKERTSTNSAICNANRPGWQCVDWPFDSYSAGTYALVLARPGSPDPQRAKMHGTTPATTTASHKTWRSLDYGVTWTEIANTELCHAAYGYTPPPDPPPPAAIGNWYITNVVQTETPNGYQIVVTTNVPAHLFLRWTLAPPGQHIKTVMARGAPVQKIIDQCFVATNDINQAEDGDTLTHTFLVEPWPVCQTRWFYFWGVRVMYRQPSVSPIYEKHKVPNVLPTPRCNATSPPNGGLVYWACHELSSGFRPVAGFRATSIDIQLYRISSNPQCRYLSLQFWTALTTAKPNALLYGTYTAYVPDIPPYGDGIVNLPLPNLVFNAGTNYCLAYRFADIQYYHNNPVIGRRMTYGTHTCPIVPTVSRNLWERPWRLLVWGTRCLPPTADWTPYLYPRDLTYKFYGTDL